MFKIKNKIEPIILALFINMAIAGPFDYSQSVLQAAYFFNNVTINNENIDSDDWVGAFCNDQCVGAAQWDTDSCGNGVCSINVNGEDAQIETTNYCTSGDIVSFQIYDTSSDQYLEANPSTIEPWSNGEFFLIDELSASEGGCDLTENNLYLYIVASFRYII